MLLTCNRQKYFKLLEYIDNSFLLIERIMIFVTYNGSKTGKKEEKSTS